MNTSTVLAVLLAALTVVPSPAGAQHLKLQMERGLVTLEAQNVSVRQILSEWARIGGATIVNGDKVMGAPVTLQLNAVPERQALDVILRGVSGFMLASRQDPAPGLSAFDRIMILPTSAAPRTPPPAPNAFSGRAVPRPMQQPEAMPVEDVVADDDQDQPGEAEPEVIEEEPAQPQPGMNPRFQRAPGFPNPMGGAPIQPFSPQTVPVPQEDEEGGSGQATPSQNPFNIPPGASTMPGVIAPLPQDERVDSPPRTRRPPL